MYSSTAQWHRHYASSQTCLPVQGLVMPPPLVSLFAATTAWKKKGEKNQNKLNHEKYQKEERLDVYGVCTRRGFFLESADADNRLTMTQSIQVPQHANRMTQFKGTVHPIIKNRYFVVLKAPKTEIMTRWLKDNPRTMEKLFFLSTELLNEARGSSLLLIFCCEPSITSYYQVVTSPNTRMWEEPCVFLALGVNCPFNSSWLHLQPYSWATWRMELLVLLLLQHAEASLNVPMT